MLAIYVISMCYYIIIFIIFRMITTVIVTTVATTSTATYTMAVSTDKLSAIFVYGLSIKQIFVPA